MQTEVVAASPGIARAVELLRAGEIVALPTETVYGLAADARKADAVIKIFEAKERPRFDPLIVHVPTRESLQLVARMESELASDLAETFWPGPLTVVLAKGDLVPDLVTAGLNTVAVRMSDHPVFHAIITAFGGPLAAPSANRFGRISPTAAQHVYDELAGRIPLIVDGGATTHGLESTIVRVVVGDTIEILRQGPITVEVLREFGPIRVRDQTGRVIVPGQLPTHYAPRTKLILVDDLAAFSPTQQTRVGALSLRSAEGFAASRCLSQSGDLREAASNLFGFLRELDVANVELIVAEKVPNVGIGAAINERLRRAAAN